MKFRKAVNASTISEWNVIKLYKFSFILQTIESSLAMDAKCEELRSAIRKAEVSHLCIVIFVSLFEETSWTTEPQNSNSEFWLVSQWFIWNVSRRLISFTTVLKLPNFVHRGLESHSNFAEVVFAQLLYFNTVYLFEIVWIDFKDLGLKVSNSLVLEWFMVTLAIFLKGIFWLPLVLVIS